MTTTPSHAGSAAQEVHWLDWGPDVFQKARREGKLIVLDSGATWCHWCHVMDAETYGDPQVAALLNGRFIPVRIDRDRLPHVDAYYQRSVALVRSQGGGWPLTVVLTPEGHVLYKATFLPPSRRAGIGEVRGGHGADRVAGDARRCLA